MNSFKIGLATLGGVVGVSVGAVAATVYLLDSDPLEAPNYSLSSTEIDDGPTGTRVPVAGNLQTGDNPSGTSSDSDGEAPDLPLPPAPGFQPEEFPEIGQAMPPAGLPLIVGDGRGFGGPGGGAPGRGPRGGPRGGLGSAGFGGFGPGGNGAPGSSGGGSGAGGGADNPDAPEGETPGEFVEEPPEIVEDVLTPLLDPQSQGGEPIDIAELAGEPPADDPLQEDDGEAGEPTYTPTAEEGGGEGANPPGQSGSGEGEDGAAQPTGDGAAATGISEPAGWALLLPGLAALAWRRMRRRVG